MNLLKLKWATGQSTAMAAALAVDFPSSADGWHWPILPSGDGWLSFFWPPAHVESSQFNGVVGRGGAAGGGGRSLRGWEEGRGGGGRRRFRWIAAQKEVTVRQGRTRRRRHHMHRRNFLQKNV